MSNPTSVVTERRLEAFYQEILPYLGGSADAGFTPVGSIIAIMGVTAPANYLACNGQIVNVADYPELANYFEQQFGTKYKFGGSGTTFGIPDLRGEFLRGTGTNSHTNQGDGANVGVHQDGTEVNTIYTQSNNNVRFLRESNQSTEGPKSVDGEISLASGRNFIQVSNGTYVTEATPASPYRYTTRPTNTSILWCIATKDIYLNPAMDYSTSEKVVGKWIDGKTLYQKTLIVNSPSTSQVSQLVPVASIGASVETVVDYNALVNYEGTRTVQKCSGIIFNNDNTNSLKITVNPNGTNTDKNMILMYLNGTAFANIPIHITIQYTKTT